MGETTPRPALSYNVTTACDVFAGQVALAKDALRSQTGRPAPRPAPFPVSQRGGTRTQPAAKDIFQPFAQAAGKGGAGQEPALTQRDEGDGPRRELCVSATSRHLTPLFHTSSPSPFVFRWCVSRLAALPCDRLQPRGEWSVPCQAARPPLSLSLVPSGPCLQPWRRTHQIFLTSSFLSNTFPSVKDAVLRYFTPGHR